MTHCYGKNFPETYGTLSAEDNLSLKTHSREHSPTSLQHSINSSPADDDQSSVPATRPRSVASSGFSSARSTISKIIHHNSVIICIVISVIIDERNLILYLYYLSIPIT